MFPFSDCPWTRFENAKHPAARWLWGVLHPRHQHDWVVESEWDSSTWPPNAHCQCQACAGCGLRRMLAHYPREGLFAIYPITHPAMCEYNYPFDRFQVGDQEFMAQWQT